MPAPGARSAGCFSIEFRTAKGLVRCAPCKGLESKHLGGLHQRPTGLTGQGAGLVLHQGKGPRSTTTTTKAATARPLYRSTWRRRESASLAARSHESLAEDGFPKKREDAGPGAAGEKHRVRDGLPGWVSGLSVTQPQRATTNGCGEAA